MIKRILALSCLFSSEVADSLLGSMGSYTSRVWLMIGKLENIYGDHFLRWQLNFACLFLSSVPVRGFYVYGGGYGPDGKAQPILESFSVCLCREKQS